MKEHKLKQLDAKLKKMLQQADQSEGKCLEPTTQFQNGNVIFIRHRKGKETGIYRRRPQHGQLALVCRLQARHSHCSGISQGL